MDKKIIVTAVAILVAISSVFLFVGMTNSFQKKIDYLSDRYAIFECKTPWKEYPSLLNKEMQGVNMQAGTWEFEVKEAASWTAFKSLLQIARARDSHDEDRIFYDLNARVIWFTAFEYEYNSFGYPTYLRIIIWFTRG